jgi:hypothetical protein
MASASGPIPEHGLCMDARIRSFYDPMYATFVACFCENGNLLSQWRAYARTAGYSIGFDRASLAGTNAAAEPKKSNIAEPSRSKA